MARPDYLLAAHADVDRRSAARALKEGAASVRGRAGERIAEAARVLGLALGPPGQSASQSAGTTEPSGASK